MIKHVKREQSAFIFLYVATVVFTAARTNHLQKRVAAHQSGKGGKYTRSHLPVRLAYYETAVSREAALRREAAIKKLSRKKKLELIDAGPAYAGIESCQIFLIASCSAFASSI